MTIDGYLTLSVADCKRLGYLAPQETRAGAIVWKRGCVAVASIGFATMTQGVPMARFSYEYQGRTMTYDVALRWKRSNLSPDSLNGYYYFVCPETGALCRKLYLVNGRFVSREAFRPLYYQQTLSRKERAATAPLRDYLAADDLINQRFRRETYRGRTTPYGRKVCKVQERVKRHRGAATN